MSYYRTGTITIVDRTVIGNGTMFSAYAKIGDMLVVNGVVGVIENVAGNESLLLTDTWAGPGVAGSSDWILLNTGADWSSVRVLNQTLANILRRLDEGVPFRPDDWIDNIAQRALFINRNAGFILGRTDTNPFQVSVKRSAGDVWTDWKDIRGNQGPAGSPGTIGPIGPTGAASTVPGPDSWATPVVWVAGLVCSASAPRTTVVYDGELYFCIVQHTAASTFNAANWIKVARKGDDGEAGPQGRTIHTLAGTAGPTNGLGANNDYAFNPTTLILYGPKAGGTWPAGVSLAQLPPVTEVTTTGGTLNLTYGAARHYRVTLAHNVTSLNITGWPAAGSLARLSIEFVNTGGFLVTFPNTWKWSNRLAPQITAGAGARDWVAVTTTDGGSNIDGHVVGQNYGPVS